MKFNTTVAIWKGDKCYVATSLENEVASQGETIDEAVSNLREALELHFEDETELPQTQRMLITSLEFVI